MSKVNKRRWHFFWLSFFIFSLCFGQFCAPRELEEFSDAGAEADACIRYYLELGGFSGAVLIARNGEILLKKGYGMANHELDVPNSPRTKFQIASVSKSFTAAAIIILEEQGLLSAKDSLAKFIPDYPEGEKITVHHLLTHTSGIPDVNQFREYDQKAKFPQTLEGIVDMFKHEPLIMEPGEKYSYSNSNYNLLAYIIEKVTGKSYGEFLRETVFIPLGMLDTGHRADMAALLKNRASGYVPLDSNHVENAPYLDWSIKTGNGSLYSTVEDLYKWDRAFYSEKILKKSSLEKIFKDHLEGKGYGWFIRERFGRKVTSINGRSPGFSSYLERYIDDDACIIILSNNYAAAPFSMIQDLAAILFGEEYEKPTEIQTSELGPDILNSLTGRYQFGPDFYRPNAVVNVRSEEGQLVFQWSETYVSPLTTISESSFLDLYFWAFITFQKNSEGEISGFVWKDPDEFHASRSEGD